MDENELVLLEVSELTGEECGCWLVTTEHSEHTFDLDAGTVERVPGPDAVQFSKDRRRPLRTIEQCQVGKRGYWTMFSDDFMAEFEWHLSTEVLRIVSVPVTGSADAD